MEHMISVHGVVKITMKISCFQHWPNRNMQFLIYQVQIDLCYQVHLKDSMMKLYKSVAWHLHLAQDIKHCLHFYLRSLLIIIHLEIQLLASFFRSSLHFYGGHCGMNLFGKGVFFALLWWPLRYELIWEGLQPLAPRQSPGKSPITRWQYCIYLLLSNGFENTMTFSVVTQCHKQSEHLNMICFCVKADSSLTSSTASFQACSFMFLYTIFLEHNITIFNDVTIRCYG
jgi:hypothetical protein